MDLGLWLGVGACPTIPVDRESLRPRTAKYPQRNMADKPNYKGLSFPLVLAIATLLASCANMDTQRDPNFDAASVRAFAWKSPPQVSDPTGESNERVIDDVRRTVTREFEARGIERVTAGKADVLVEVMLSVQVRLQENDPNFSLFIAEKWEEGTMTVRLLDPATDRTLWHGSCGHRLRYSARSLGGTVPTFEPTGQRRDWRTEELVERLVDAALNP